MASAGYRKRVSPRTGRISYQVWWIDDSGTLDGAARSHSEAVAAHLLPEASALGA